MAFNFPAYMKFLAVSSKHLKHTEDKPRYFRVSGIMSLDELLAKLNRADDTILIVQDNAEGTVGDGYRTDNYQDKPYFVFYVAQRTDRPFDADGLDALKQHCKAVGMTLLSKIRVDKEMGKYGLDFAQLGNVPYQTIGPFANGWYGVMFSFSINEFAANMNYADEDWEYPAPDSAEYINLVSQLIDLENTDVTL